MNYPDSFGASPSWHKFRFGQCRECFDQRYHRQTGTCLGKHGPSLASVCHHRLPHFRKLIPWHKLRLLDQYRP